ncbi:glutamine-dependent NAD(+) synthetase nadE [Mycobacterium tuberculosis]|nr:glutamine-dependent NAD(+) synthetase nadE [Mycobacterium tuberculosis]CML48902.1 glutamine-dependent NAD(+) synthetase nadE [Mycobacterium tuberculosis]
MGLLGGQSGPRVGSGPVGSIPTPVNAAICQQRGGFHGVERGYSAGDSGVLTSLGDNERTMNFYSAYQHGFVRVAACTHHTTIGDPAANAASVLDMARACHDDGAALAVFPELTLSGYSIEDVLLQDSLLDAVEDALLDLVTESADLLPVLVVGAPLRHRHRIYNTAVVIHRGAVLGVVPKSYLPTYREFYERRQMAPGDGERGTIRIGGADVAFGTDLLFAASDLPGFVLHVEICEDMFVPMPPSAEAALAGATVLANLSGSPITIGRAEDRRLLARSASARCLAAYVYAAAGEGESTTDLAWDGQTMIWENGALLAESERFPKGVRRSVADVDTELLRSERLRMGTFDDNRRHHRELTESFRRIDFALDPPAGDIGLLREVERFPFVPADPQRLQQDCYEAYNIQVSGLEQRLRALDYPKVVIGVSGGLDSTHALIVATHAMDREGRPRSDILAFALPGFATGEHTKNNAIKLARALGVTFSEIDIGDTARLMLHTIGHPYSVGEKVYDVTFENVQAGLRTDYLFRIANQRGGIVLGTGDLSELALGWSTYGVGDQMSHYNVNAGVPKTLIQHLIRWVISAGSSVRRWVRYCSRCSTPRSPPNSFRPARRSCRAARPRSDLSPYRTFRFFRYCATDFARRRLRFWPGMRGTMRSGATGRPASQRANARPIHWPKSGIGCRFSSSGFIRLASSSVRHCPTAPRCPTGARCRRVGIGGPRRICQRESGSIRSTVRCPRASGSTPHPGRTGRRWRCSRGRRHCASATGRVLRRGGHAPRAWQRAG